MQFKFSFCAPALLALLFAGPAWAEEDELEITMEVMDSSDDFHGNEMTLDVEEEEPAEETGFLSDLVAGLTDGDEDGAGDDAEVAIHEPEGEGDDHDGVDMNDDLDFAGLNEDDHDVADDMDNDDVREEHEEEVSDEVIEDDVIEDEVIEDEVIEDEVIEEEPVDEEPVDEEPIDEEPIDEEPVDEQPIDEEPVDEAPVDEEVSADMEATDDAVVD
jgi:hypothetical protein